MWRCFSVALTGGTWLSNEHHQPTSLSCVLCLHQGPAQRAAQLGLVSLLFSEQTYTENITCCVSLGDTRVGGCHPPMDRAYSQP